MRQIIYIKWHEVLWFSTAKTSSFTKENSKFLNKYHESMSFAVRKPDFVQNIANDANFERYKYQSFQPDLWLTK